MNSLRCFILIMALCIAINGVSQTNSPDYRNIYLNARQAVLYPAAYKDEGFLKFFESWMAVDKSASYNSILKNAEKPSNELRIALDSLKKYYNSLVKIHEYNEVSIDIWGGHRTIPIPGGTEENSLENENGWLADDPGFRPFLIDYRLQDPANAKGTIITIPSIRGAYDELTMVARNFNNLGFNVFALQARMNTVDRKYYGLQLDAQRAIRYIRYHAKDLGIDANKIASIGGSKGNFSHIMTYEYFDKTPVQYAAEVLNKPLKDYLIDSIDNVPSNVSALIFSYGSAIMGKDFSALTIKSSHIYSKTMFDAGFRFPHIMVLSGNYDNWDVSELPVVISALSEYNSSPDKSYEIAYEVHLCDKVNHGFGSGYKYPNIMNLWDVVGTFLEMNLGKWSNSTLAQTNSKVNAGKDYLSIEEAMALLRVPEAAAPLAYFPEKATDFAEFVPIKPIKLFDHFYFVGTTMVGAFIVETEDGLVMLDTGCDDEDAAMMVQDMKKLGLDPAKIKLILLSHEHFDHYGGVQYLKKNVCPDARVAISLIGWNMLQTVPLEGPFIGKRPQSIDIYLTDGMKIKVGNTVFQIISTPGHSPGCVSFIIPVTDNGEQHIVGIMGGSAVFPSQVETHQYKASVEYFKAFTDLAHCDVGLYFHSQEADFAALRIHKPNEPHPLVLGTDKFDSIYLQSFRDRYQKMIDSGNLKPY